MSAAQKFIFNGWEAKAVVLVDPATGESYKATASGGAGGGGDASAANQATGNASLTSIDGKTPALVSGAVPVAVANFPSIQPVSGTFWPATQPVSGSFWQATQPVSGTFWQATQPVSGPLTDTQLRAVAVPVSLASVPSHAVTGPLTDTQLRAVAVPVSAAALPLPAGAASETTLAALNAKFSALGTPWQFAGIAGGIINTTDAVVAAAAGASLRNYVKSLQMANGSASVSSEVVIKDGSTVIWRGWVGTAAQTNGSCNPVFDPPLRSSLNTALNIACLTTAMALRVSAQGYTAP